MKSFFRAPRAVDIVLVLAIVVDVSLVALTVLKPDWWFAELHGVGAADAAGPFAYGLLFRASAHWAAFAAFQITALSLWRSHLVWLPIVAGLRFSDVFTDWTYLVAAPPTGGPDATIGLMLPAFMNWGMALFLLWHWRLHAPDGST